MTINMQSYLNAVFGLIGVGLSTGIVISVFILVCNEIINTFKISSK